MAKRRVKVMWDYDAFPVWSVRHGGMQVSVEGLAISAALKGDLQRWSDEWTRQMWGEHGPDSPKWRPPDPAVREEWDTRGRTLAARLQSELGADVDVGYFDEAIGDVEWPADPQT